MDERWTARRSAGEQLRSGEGFNNLKRSGQPIVRESNKRASEPMNKTATQSFRPCPNDNNQPGALEEISYGGLRTEHVVVRGRCETQKSMASKHSCQQRERSVWRQTVLRLAAGSPALRLFGKTCEWATNRVAGNVRHGGRYGSLASRVQKAGPQAEHDGEKLTLRLSP